MKGIHMLTATMLLCAAPLLPATPPPVPGAGSDRAAGVVTRIYHIYRLETDDAYRRAISRCEELAPEGSCSGQSFADEDFFELSAPPAVQAEVAALLAELDAPEPAHLLRIHLILADSDPSGSAPLPADAAAALSAVRSLLPHRGYSVLDSGSIRTREEGYLVLGGEQGYSVLLGLSGGRAPSEVVHVMLFVLNDRAVAPMKEGEVEVSENPLLRSSFSARPGETVLVGAGSFGPSDEPLVVLVTLVE